MNIAWYICCMRSEVERHVRDVEAWCDALHAQDRRPGMVNHELVRALHDIELGRIVPNLKGLPDSPCGLVSLAVDRRGERVRSLREDRSCSEGRLVGWNLFQSDHCAMARESGVVCEMDCPFPDFWIACISNEPDSRIISWFPAAYVPAITHALELMPTQAAWWVNDDFEFLPPFES
jgi:hypothetical protein